MQRASPHPRPALARLADLLRLRLAQLPAEEALRLMGYARITPANRARLETVLADPWLGLREAGFDMRYASADFLRALARVAGLGAADYEPVIERVGQWLLEEREAFKPYLFVDTGFRRDTQPLFALAVCESQRHLRFAEGFWRLPLAEQLSLAQERVREHMQETGGELGIWGVTRRYLFFHARQRALVLSLNGLVQGEHHAGVPSSASLSPAMHALLADDIEDRCRI